MGIIYKGWHLTLDQPIAIKVVRPEYADNAEAVSRFLNEARAVAALRAVNVAQVLDVGRIKGGVLYMVMEYLEGVDVRDALDHEGRPFSIERAVDIVRQACAAMQVAHAAGIIHRDLKPENLFIARLADGQEVVKVIDFGVSKRPSLVNGRSFTEAGRSLGSPHYMSPEQISTPDAVDGRADIWSLGVVLYELLSNKLPFNGDSAAATCALVLCAEPAPLASLRQDVPPGLAEIVARCMKKNASERFSSALELSEALAEFGSARAQRASFNSYPGLEGARAEEAEESLDDALPRPRHRAFWPLVAAIGVAACAVIAASNWRSVERDATSLAKVAEVHTKAATQALSASVRNARIGLSDWIRPADSPQENAPTRCPPAVAEPTRVAVTPNHGARTP